MRSAAFHAPMKPPSSNRPSGDRTMARLLLKCLSNAGYHPEIVSEYVSRDGRGSLETQSQRRAEGEAEAERVLAKLKRNPPAFWLTYHLYHKAPDWLGPRISQALGIPYIVVEASVAEKQADGQWASGYAATIDALARADLVLQPNPDDLAGVAPYLSAATRMETLKVPIDCQGRAPRENRAVQRAALARRWGVDENTTWIVCAAMMRPGAKHASYRVMAESLRRVTSSGWSLIAAGDGPARDDVLSTFSNIRSCHFPGELSGEEIADLYAVADLYFWPGVEEAFGYATLEAQAAGLPGIVGDRAGIRALTDPDISANHYPPEDSEAFAAALDRLLRNPADRDKMSVAALENVRTHHDIKSVSHFLKDQIEPLLTRRVAS